MLIENNKIRWAVIGFTVLLAVWWMTPHFFEEQKWWLPKEKLVYGLDIQGGLHLVMGVDVEGVVKNKITRSKNAISELLEKKDIKIEKAFVDSNLRIIVRLKNSEDADQAASQVEDEYGAVFQVLSSNEGEIEWAYSQVQQDSVRKEVIQQSIEVIRNRVDEFGVSEPLITAQGSNRVLVQLPGIQSAQRAKELIQKTARLELRLVSNKMDPQELLDLISSIESKKGYSLDKEGSYRAYVKRLNEDLRDQLPENTSIAFMKDESSRTLSAGRVAFLLETDTGLSGDMLEDASVGQGQFGEPIVNFRFGVEGRKRFSEVTAKSIGRLMAIVLDEVVKTAPEIKDHLFDSATITLGSGDRNKMLEEAEMISTTLRAGALPAELKQLEERTVGPTLGRDHIEKGKLAALTAIIAILIFLIIYFNILGLVADISLLLNIGFLIACLTSFGAALTLPGVAGIILTVGMAVDANIIIFERIKEEFKKGSSLKLAVNEGFARAFSAILDANITTAIVCLILMYFGTGPIRGFAVTLFCGIVTSVFTAIFVSRTLINSILLVFKPKSLWAEKTFLKERLKV